MRLAPLLALVVVVAAGCGSHHRHHAAAHKRPVVKITYRVVSMGRPGCNLLPLTEREMRRWLHRCGGG